MVVVADSSFAALNVGTVPDEQASAYHHRLRLDAQLYRPAPLRRSKQMGRPRKVGKRLPGLKALVNNPYTPWQTVEMKDWYGQLSPCTSPQQPQFGTKLGCQPCPFAGS